MIIGLAGQAGAGKDTAADFLTQRHGFTKIALADPMKRFCKEIFQFSDEQLWGPSAKRNAPDSRYPRVARRTLHEGDVYQCLTPRYTLQRLGTEWGRDCYEDVWVRYALENAVLLLGGGGGYTQSAGLYVDETRGPAPGVVIPDIRFPNELEAIRGEGGQVWWIDRPGAGLSGKASEHSSENSIKSEDCDLIIKNDGSLEDLFCRIGQAVDSHACGAV